MRNWGWLCLVGLGSWGLLACTGGQSGTEGGIPACARPTISMDVGLDDATPFGTPREVFQQILATPNLPRFAVHWSTADGRSSDTTATLSLGGEPTNAHFVGYSWDSTACGSVKLDGATLHFKTDDGAFDESASGSFTRQTSGLEPADLIFDGRVPTPFAGSYDTSPLLTEHPQDIVELYTALELDFAFPGAKAGELAFEKNEQERYDFEIATWTVPSSGGFGGADTSVAGGGAYGGGGGSAGGAGGASDAGSGGAVGGIGGG